jgi:acyl dehydratase
VPVSAGTNGPYEVVAHNTATTSTNKIHDDEVARRYGFGGGLVPGVDVYAYMTRPAAATWGLEWLGAGSMRARFLAPVYEGQRVVVVAGEAARTPAGTMMPIDLRDESGTVCATGEAGLYTGDNHPPLATTWPTVDPADAGEAGDDRPVASPESLAAGTVLALAPHGFHAGAAGEYLADVREDLPLYADSAVAQPGWLLRDANYVLSANVTLGPWIHVESHVRHHSLVRDGESVEARAIVTREWAHKGHQFVELDVGLVAGGDRVAARVTHTAIYRPRTPTSAPAPARTPT